MNDVTAFSRIIASALLDAVQRVMPDHIVHEEEDGNSTDDKASLLFIQVINHGIEHRTNITTILSGMGLLTLELDGWGYLFAHPDRLALKKIFREGPRLTFNLDTAPRFILSK